jgi:GT2 family glycosyltransferase
MIDTPKITFCIPSNNNLRYLKKCIPSIRNNARNKTHDIIIFVDRDNDGTIEWLESNRQQFDYTYYVNPDLNITKLGIAKAYDYCIERTNTDIFMLFHADMVLGIDADHHALKYLKPKTVVCSTRIEPPIFPSAGEKIIKDFGLWTDDLNEEEFKNETIKLIESYTNKTTSGIFAPWAMYKKDFESLGGHDHNLMSFKEDSDIFNRMKINGFELIQSWSSIVYHFCGRGGRFEDDRIDHYFKKSEEQASERKFIRKWGSGVKSTILLDPIIGHKYDIAIIASGFDPELIKNIEPIYNDIYATKFDIDQIESYVSQELSYGSDISNKFHILRENLSSDSISNDVIIFTDDAIDKSAYEILINIHDIIREINTIGSYQIGNIKCIIKNIYDTLEEYKING